MRDLYVAIVVLTAAAHFAFIGYMVIGGFLALRWPRTIWLHVPAAIWGIAIEVFDFTCPLTWLERWARARAAMSPLAPNGFIDHYITGVWYPASAATLVLILVFSTICLSWILFAVMTKRRRSAAVGMGTSDRQAR
jgi:Protein of Unknown function (DUF2784)